MSFLHHEINKSRLVLLIALVFTALGAGIFRTPPILFMAAVLCSAPVIGSLIGRLAGRKLSVSRALPDSGMAGETVTARLSVRNGSRWPALMVHLRGGAMAKPRNRSWGWAKSADEADDPALEIAGQDEEVVPILAPGAREDWQQTWHLKRRGVHQIEGAAAGALDPLGLYARLDARTPPHEIVVLPRPLKISRLGWSGGSSGGSQTPLQAIVAPDAMDFHGVRPHQPGEGLRRVHWKSTARTGQLHVIDWEDEVASDLTVILDAQATIAAGHGAQSTFETSITLCASVAAFLLENGFHFQVFCWENGEPKAKTKGERRKTEAPIPGLHLGRYEGRNIGLLRPILHSFARLELVNSPDATLARLVQNVRPHLAPGRGVLLVSTNLAAVAPALLALQALPGVRAQALVLDAFSFAGGEHGASLGAPMGGAKLPPGAKLVRQGDSLTGILERGA